MDLIQAMRIFAKTADTESFTKAAEQLGLSIPVVTRHIANLEKYLNARLLSRTTRRVVLTEVGYAYLEGCKSVLDQIEGIEKNVTCATHETQGMLRLAASTPFALSYLAPLLASYQTKYPNIRLQLSLVDREIDFIEEGVDAAILADYMVASPLLVARPLREYHYAIAAAPSYLEKAGMPQTPDALKELRFLGRPADIRGCSLKLAAKLGHRSTLTVPLMPAFICNNVMMLHQLAKDGMGIAVLPSVLIEQDVQANKLIPILNDYEIVDSVVRMCLVYPNRQFVTRKLRTFIEHVIDTLGHTGTTGH